MEMVKNAPYKPFGFLQELRWNVRSKTTGETIVESNSAECYGQYSLIKIHKYIKRPGKLSSLDCMPNFHILKV